MPPNTTQPQQESKQISIIDIKKDEIAKIKEQLGPFATEIEKLNKELKSMIEDSDGDTDISPFTDPIENKIHELIDQETEIKREYKKQNENLIEIQRIIDKGQKSQENKFSNVIYDLSERLRAAEAKGNTSLSIKLKDQLEALMDIKRTGEYGSKVAQQLLVDINNTAKGEENLKAIKEVGKTLKDGYEKQLQIEKGTWESVSVQRQIAINQEVAKTLQKEEEDREAARREIEVKRLIESQRTIADRVRNLKETLSKDLKESSTKLGKDVFGLMSAGMSGIIAESFGSGPMGMLAMSIFGAMERSIGTLATHGYDALKAMLWGPKPLQVETKEKPIAQNALQTQASSAVSSASAPTADAPAAVSSDPPKGTGGWLSGIADAIKPFGSSEILRAATSMLVVATSIGVLGGAVLLFAQSSLAALMKTVVGMGALVATMYAISKIEKDIYKGASALLSISASIALIAGAFILFNYVNWGAVLVGAAAIGILVGVAVLLGVFSKIIAPGVLILMNLAIAMGIFAISALIFSTALIMLATAFTILGPAMISFLAYTPLIIPFGLAILTLSIFMAAAAPGILLFGVALTILAVPLLIASIAVNLLALSFKTFAEYGAMAGLGLLAFTYTALFAIPGLFALVIPLAIVGPLMLIMGISAILAATSMLILAHAINTLADIGIWDILKIAFVLAAVGGAVLGFSILLGIAAPFILLFGASLVVLASSMMLITVPALILSSVVDGLMDSLERALDIFREMGSPDVIFGMLAFALALPILGIALAGFSIAMIAFAFASLIFGNALGSLIMLGQVGPGIMDAADGIEKLGESIGKIGGRSVRDFAKAMGQLGLALGLLSMSLTSFAIASIFFGNSLDSINDIGDSAPELTQAGNAIEKFANSVDKLTGGALVKLSKDIMGVVGPLRWLVKIGNDAIEPLNALSYSLWRITDAGADLDIVRDAFLEINESLVNLVQNVCGKTLLMIAFGLNTISMAVERLSSFNPFHIIILASGLRMLSETGDGILNVASGLESMNNILENIDIDRIYELTKAIRGLSLSLLGLGFMGPVLSMVVSRFTKKEESEKITTRKEQTQGGVAHSIVPEVSATSRLSSGLMNIGRGIFNSVLGGKKEKEKEGDVAIINNASSTTTTSTTASPIYSAPPAGMQIRDGEPSFRRINMLQFAGARV